MTRGEKEQNSAGHKNTFDRSLESFLEALPKSVGGAFVFLGAVLQDVLSASRMLVRGRKNVESDEIIL